ncbi:MAG: Rne/Rng family ribonuclease [Phycisphaerae bacterium]|nr:Rne/Rng family ribonuclease [Phycisphaerae bacterium]
MSKLMLINTVAGQECRIAILHDKRLEELYTERASSASQVGNIYKGRITNIEPSIQAAFIDFGGVKNGFLHISDVHPQFFPTNGDEGKGIEQVGRRTAHRTRPPIQNCLKRGQEVVVQMTKQGIGTKGPTLTTYLSIPGRLMVMMPGMSRTGISRKIEDEDIRAKIRKMLEQVDVPKGMGIIVRTAGIDRTKRDLQRDISYLARLWTSVNKDIEDAPTPSEVYQESDLVIRTIRDVFDSEIERIICDSKEVAVNVKDFLNLALPRAKCKVELYTGKKGVFEEFSVEEEIQKIHSHRVEMKNGGSLVIDQTEALVAIDVNSGSFRAHSDAESNALSLNLTAAEEIGRQLRLRDMGGVIIIDFVDLRDEKHRRQLERKLRDILKKDRAKSKVLRISSFGIVEMTRQRLRPSLKQSIYSRCPHCEGTGQIMSQESVALSVMRNLQVACANADVAEINITVSPLVAHHLSNSQRNTIAELEQRTGKAIVVTADSELGGNDVKITCVNHRGTSIAWDARAKGGKKQSGAEMVDVDTLLGKKKGKPAKAKKPAKAEAATNDAEAESDETPAADANKEKDGAEAAEEKPAKKSRRRGRRGGRKNKKASSSAEEQANTSEDKTDEKPAEDSTEKTDEKAGEKTDEKAGEKTAKKSPRRRRSKSAKSAKPADSAESDSSQQSEAADKSGDGETESQTGAEAETEIKNSSDTEKSGDEAKSAKKSRRRGRRGGRKHRKTPATDSEEIKNATDETEQPEQKKTKSDEPKESKEQPPTAE